ncbi:MAG TPA: thioredoxin family protein [Chryseolinea sp.]
MKILLMTFIFIATGPVEWLSDFEAAKTIAEQNHKHILLNFSGSDWCAPCIKMKQEVFENDAFLRIAEKQLVLLRADFPRAKKNQLSKEQQRHNEALAEKYNPAGKFPYTLLLDADGKILWEWDGYTFSSQDKFLSQLSKELKMED